MFVLREPIHTMGDWRRPKNGLTKNERGLPLGLLERTLANAGFRVVRRRYHSMPTTARFARLLRLQKPYDKRPLVAADAAMSRLMSWNLHYHRDTLAKKLAPSAVFEVLQKI